jgi:hypothetical protein
LEISVQFTVLIEFLIPGLVTVLLVLAMLPRMMVPGLLPGVTPGDTVMALVLLAVSYPVGHLVNFPVYMWLQRRLLAPRARKHTVEAYSTTDAGLATRVSRELGFRVGADTRDERQELFNYMEAIILCRNIEQFNSHDLFYKSLQRLARGMLIPLLLAIFVVFYRDRVSAFSLVSAFVLLVFFVVCFFLLKHFIQVEEDEIARFFVTLTSMQPQREV